jgi:Flp pilus assembly protein TadG
MTHPRRAAAAVELALLLPFLALLFAVVVDFGRVFHATQVLQTAASNAAAVAGGETWVAASAGSASDQAKAAAATEGASLNPPLRTDQVTVTVSGGRAAVSVDYDFPMLTGFLYPGGTVRLQRTATAPVAPRTGD